MALDEELRAELGAAYSDEVWTNESFVAERPGKWRLSRLAFDGDRLRAFWIASLAGDDAHTHRVGVHASVRRLGIARAIAEEVHDEARKLGARRMTLFVNADNVEARAAYERLGYRRCEVDGRPAMERVLCE